MQCHCLFLVKRKPGPAPIMKRRKELKEGEFDVDSVMPWKLDFNTTEKEATFWLWEQKWRTFYNFIGKLQYICTVDVQNPDVWEWNPSYLSDTKPVRNSDVY